MKKIDWRRINSEEGKLKRKINNEKLCKVKCKLGSPKELFLIFFLYF